MFLDSHAHITTPSLKENVEEILKNAQEASVDTIINICTDKETLESGLLLAEKHPWVYNSAATTPHDVEKEGELYFPIMEKSALSGKLVAVGETGLDYFYEHSNREIQREFFVRYLHLAMKAKLPVVIHCRDAFDDLFKIIDREYTPKEGKAPGVLHCFTGNLDEAMAGVERGWYISISGIATFKKSKELRDVIKKIPLEHLLIETDTPYLAPQSRRGKPNQPSYLPETAQVVADTKGITLEELAAATTANGKRLFAI